MAHRSSPENYVLGARTMVSLNQRGEPSALIQEFEGR